MECINLGPYLIQLPVAGAGTNAFDEILKAAPPALVAFLANLPAVEGNFRKYCTIISYALSIVLFCFFYMQPLNMLLKCQYDLAVYVNSLFSFFFFCFLLCSSFSFFFLFP